MKKKAKVAANRTPKVRRPSLLERIEETEDFMSNFDEELGKLQTSNGALANRISAIEALPDVDALAKRVKELETGSDNLERRFDVLFDFWHLARAGNTPAPKSGIARPECRPAFCPAIGRRTNA